MPNMILGGCRTKPLASYLKAIGILRILSEQIDPGAKGYWCAESFVVNTRLSEDEFIDFFCNEYAPTPIVSPWNGGSGFYAGDVVDGIDAILCCDDSRFRQYQRVILEVRSWPEIPSFTTIRDVLAILNEELAVKGSAGEKGKIKELLKGIEAEVEALSRSLGQDVLLIPFDIVQSFISHEEIADIPSNKKWWGLVKKARTKATELKRKKEKERILPICRAKLPESSVQWLDAVGAIQENGSGFFNPLLGTGGNEGRFEFSNNFMQRLAELFIQGDPATSRDLFSAATNNNIISGLIRASIGQYDPGRAGGYNQGMGVETKDFKINPWDYVLAIEGSLVFASAVVRRNPTEDRTWLTVPFSVNFSSVGFSSSAIGEAGRKELWVPLWRNPALFSEIRQLFSEGRATLGRRAAESAIEFSRAVGTMGVDRGIDSFERYAFLMRRGQSYVALPAGRVRAFYRPKLEILNELDPITRKIGIFLRSFNSAPATFRRANQNIEEATFRCSLDPSPSNFLGLIRALGQFEQLIATRDRNKEPAISYPFTGLSPRWIEYSDDGGTEVRIAAALASIRNTGRVGPMRSNLSEVDAEKPWQWSVGSRDQYWHGNDLSKRLGGVLSRRIMDAKRRFAKRFPVESHLPISSKDVMPFLWNLTDDEKIEDLLWGFCMTDWRKSGLTELSQRWTGSVSELPLARSYGVLKLLHSPQKVRGIEIRVEPRILNLLAAGRVKEACALAVRRLCAARLSPHIVDYDKDVDPIRLIAALLIPVSDQWKLESLVLKEKQ